ncbi:MAG: hypothetical protein SWK76_04575 [Actinomycetota bacterium]|nr:hypothetical protein [Actinomycetota bacterium]
MAILIIIIYVSIGISALSEIVAFAIIAIKARGSDGEIYWALAAPDEAEFIQRVKARLHKESEARSFPLPQSTLPSSDEQYYSFFHYIYLPIFSELRKKVEGLARKNLLSRLIFYGITLLLVVALLIAGEGFYIMLLVAPLLAAAVTLSIFYIYKRDYERSAHLLRELDKRFAAFNHGSPPPPYRVTLEKARAEVNARMAKKPFVPRDVLGEHSPKPEPKSWSQVAREMFSGGGDRSGEDGRWTITRRELKPGR